MIPNAQVILDNGKPAFVVLRFEDYIKLTSGKQGKDKLVPFELSDYIRNPIRVLRIKAGLKQNQLARLLGVTQGYVSRIESRDFKVGNQLLSRVKLVIARRGKRLRQ